MRIFILFIVAILALTACRTYEQQIIITTEKSKPPVVDDEPLMVYYASVNTVPDSSVYIGTFSCPKVFYYGKWTPKDMMSSMETKVKHAGGNLIIFDKKSANQDNDSFTGKIYWTEPFETTQYTEDVLKKVWNSRKPDKIEGVYEMSLAGFGDYFIDYMVKYAIVKKDENTYIMVYLRGMAFIQDLWYFNDLARLWRIGDIYAYIEKTEKPSLFKARKYEYNKYLRENIMMRVDNGNLRVSLGNDLDVYQKIYPDSSILEDLYGSLSGFALDKNRIITCYHGVAESDKKIYVKGINGDFDTKYVAQVEYFDRANDIAVLKLEDSTKIIEHTPFAVSEAAKGTAEEVFVLGYPISMIMGEEIKLTNGIISATSGVGGDMAVYQISAPVQYGNSGSPLFDKNGNCIGMVKSGIATADNVGYSLKFKHIKEFLTKEGLTMKSQPENSQKDLSLADKVKTFQNSIFLIEIIDIKTKKSAEGTKSQNKPKRRQRR